MSKSLQVTVAGVATEDTGRCIARTDAATLAALGGGTSVLLAVTGGRTAYVRTGLCRLAGLAALARDTESAILEVTWGDLKTGAACSARHRGLA